MKDYRIGQKVIATLEIEDRGQDFIELDVLENGVLLGDSAMFCNGRQSLLGIGTANGSIYHTFEELTAMKRFDAKGLLVYMYETGDKIPVPWEASTLNYPIIRVKKPVIPNRFLSAFMSK